MLVVYFMNERERWNRKEYFKNQIGRKFREWCHFIYIGFKDILLIQGNKNQHKLVCTECTLIQESVPELVDDQCAYVEKSSVNNLFSLLLGCNRHPKAMVKVVHCILPQKLKTRDEIFLNLFKLLLFKECISIYSRFRLLVNTDISKPAFLVF